MGFSFGNALAAVKDPYIRACFQRLGDEVHSTSGTVSTVIRNAEAVTPPTSVLAGVNGAGTTDFYPIYTDGAAKLVGDGSLFNSGGLVVSSLPFKVVDASAASLRLLSNATGQLLMSVTPSGAASYTASGSAPSHTYNDAFTIRNSASTTLAVRRSGGGGTDGLAIVAGAQGTTFAVTAATGTQTGFIVMPTANWGSSTVVFDVQTDLGASRFNITYGGAVTVPGTLGVTGVATFTARDVHNGGITDLSTTATQLTHGYDTNNKITWNTSSAGATVASLGSSSAASELLVIRATTAPNNDVGTFILKDTSDRQRFYFGRTTVGNAS